MMRKYNRNHFEDRDRRGGRTDRYDDRYADRYDDRYDDRYGKHYDSRYADDYDSEYDEYDDYDDWDDFDGPGETARGGYEGSRGGYDADRFDDTDRFLTADMYDSFEDYDRDVVRRRREREESRAEKEQGRKPARKRSRKRRFVILALEILLLLVIGAGVFVVSKWHKIDKNPIDALVNEDIDEDTLAAMSGYTTFALFGVDARDIKHTDKGVHGDVVMICSINNETGGVRLASIYRDTLVTQNTDNDLGKLTTTYFRGGAENAVNMLNRNFDLTIEDYITGNWRAVATAINDLGGVDVEITDEMLSYKNQINGYIAETVNSTGMPTTQITHTGLQHVDGIQAVAYCRIRYKSGDDVGRTRRQREVLKQMFELAKKADVLTLNKILDDCLPMIQTSLTEKEILQLVKLLPKLHMEEDGSEAFPKEKERRSLTYHKGAVQVPAPLITVTEHLHEFLYQSQSYTPSPMVKRISTLLDSVEPD